MQTIKNILSLIVLGLWVYFSINLAVYWRFDIFADWVVYLVIIGLAFLLAMAGVSGAQSAGKKERNPFC